MFTEKQEFDIATEKWLAMGAGLDFRREVAKPALSVLVSQYGDTRHYMKEAEQLIQFHKATGEFHRHTLNSSLSATAMHEALSDLDVTDIIVIGKGNMEEVCMGNGNYLDWVAIAALTQTHLKNSFTYRNHSDKPEPAGIPLGLFATGDHSHAYVPDGGSFTGIEHGDGIVVPSSPSWRATYAEVARRSPRG